jgi:Flp pilus assembly pilin Flp
MRSVRGRCGKFVRDESGAAIVEFALVMPILALFLFGIIDFGRAFYTMNNLVSAAREGSRLAAVLAAPLDPASQANIRTRVRNVAMPFGGDSIVDSQIEIDFDGQLVTVRIEDYPFRPLTPIANWAGWGELLMTRQATFRWERSSA